MYIAKRLQQYLLHLFDSCETFPVTNSRRTTINRHKSTEQSQFKSRPNRTYKQKADSITHLLT